ncbi:hypothetical protein MLD38_020202 [Melastoma candidum]|uniref:Uncharacterized protein n=1 Tax=Melastoma candidum TaxID=119954 RepID=A0ACB9QBS8_9MYRT|nr:hypothetical protein MLD38_020202 [Melastoma candidum]
MNLSLQLLPATEVACCRAALAGTWLAESDTFNRVQLRSRSRRTTSGFLASQTPPRELAGADCWKGSSMAGLLDGLYRVVMRRTSVYVTFVIAGAFVGERAVDYGVHKIWEMNNVGKRYEDIPVLGQRPVEE